jgi:hypothetical protein
MKESSYAESVSIVEKEADGTSAVKTTLHFESSGDMVTQRTQDMEPALKHVQIMREQNEAKGSRWGEGRLIGHIPALYYPAIAAIEDRNERNAAIQAFFREHPQFVGFSPYLKN